MKLPVLALGLAFVASSSVLAIDLGTLKTVEPAWMAENANDVPWIPSFQSNLACFCVAHKRYEPCVRQLDFLGLSDDDCMPSPSQACGHTKSLHDPVDVLTSPDFYRIVGFLTDPRADTVRVKSIFVGNAASDLVFLPFSFTVGQVSGTLNFTVLATNMPPLHYFLTPQTSPPGYCDSMQSCLTTFSIRVQVSDLIELPAPPQVFAPTGQPIPYVRCGLMASCSGTEDVPSNWSAHQRVHWGTPATVDAILNLAERWYQACSTKVSDPSTGSTNIVLPQNLAINDMSLPLGGLLDVDNDWEPTYRGQSGGHISHRNGV